MSATLSATSGIRLLSALRKSGSFTALTEIPESYFSDQVERQAFAWLRDYVREYRAFPSSDVLFDETGIRTVVTSSPLEFYIDKCRGKALHTALTPHFSAMNAAIMDKKPDKVVELAMQMVGAGSNLAPRGTGLVTIADTMRDVLADYDEAHMSTGIRGVPTAYPSLTDKSGGWQNSDLISMVGRPGTGKTYQLLRQAHAAWVAGFKPLIVSMEMNNLQISRRFLGLHSCLNPDFIRKGQLGSERKRDMLQGITSISESNIPLHLVTGSFRQSVPAIRALIEQTDPDIIFIDASYLLIPEKKRQGSGGRRESVSDVVEELKMLAVDCNRPIIQTVQFNRQAERPQRKLRTHDSDEFVVRGRDNNPPTDEQLREALYKTINHHMGHLSLAKIGETDVIGQASSIVLGIEQWMYEPYDKRRCISVLKGREGESGAFVVNYNFQPMDFTEVPVELLIAEQRIRNTEGLNRPAQTREEQTAMVQWMGHNGT